VKSIVSLDDLDLQEGLQTVAHGMVRLGWDGVWYELDLSNEHARDLWYGIEPYIKAGRREHARAKEAAPATERAAIESGVPRRSGVALYHAVGVPVRDYLKGLRKWADATGVEIEKKISAGVEYYSYHKEHYQGYESWLSEQDRQRMAG
jgi:hypothetical protein